MKTRRLNMTRFEGLLLQQIYHIAFHSIFRTTPEVSTKLYFVEISLREVMLWLFNHKRSDFLNSKFWILFSLCSLLKWNQNTCSVVYYFALLHGAHLAKYEIFSSVPFLRSIINGQHRSCRDPS